MQCNMHTIIQIPDGHGTTQQVYSVWKPMIINENLNENPLCVYHIIRYTGFWFQSKVLLNS